MATKMHPGISYKRQRSVVKIWLRVLICLVGLAGTEFTVAAGQPFVMSTSVRAPLYLEDGSGYFNQLTAEIFRRLDIESRLIHLPARRALFFANNKTVDGTGPRTAAIEKSFPNLVRVPGNVFQFEFMVYSKDPAISVNGWESLLAYSVGLINGWKIVEQNTANAKLVTRAENYDQLFQMLELGRIDVAVMDRVMAGWELKQLGLDLHAIEPPIISQSNYIYVHKEHASLVPEIARVVAEMRQDGSMAAIRARTMLKGIPR